MSAIITKSTVLLKIISFLSFFLGISMYLKANDAKNSNFEIKKPSNSSLEKRIGTFFEKLEKEQTSEAFAHLLDNSTIARKKNNVADLVKETEETLKKFGRVKEYEKIKMDKVGSRIVRLIYFSYSDDFPLKWEIYCYSGKSGWQVLDLNVNTNFYDLFDKVDQ
ncbi:MAG: hypothetical protein ACJ0IZ_09465 [Verrucomicrobiales bacterium]